MTPLDLASMTSEDESDDHVVAFERDQPIRFKAFKNHIAATIGKLTTAPRAALLCNSSYNFAVGCLALLSTGATVVVPPDLAPSAEADMGGEFDVLVDDTFIDRTKREIALTAFDASRGSIEMFTSGATGRRKRITKRLAHFQAELLALEQLWGHELGACPVFATVPHQHLYGLTFKIVWPLATRRPFVAETFGHWEECYAALKPNALLISSPAHLSRLGGLKPLPARQRPAAVISAGSALDLGACNDTQHILGCPPQEIFGSTETGAIAWRRPLTDQRWRPLPGISVRREPDGRLALKTPFADDGWVVTNDLISDDGDGFRLEGRSDDIVKIEGKRVSLRAVENTLESLAEIERASAIVVPHERPRLGAAVCLSPQGQEAFANLGAFRLTRHLRKMLLQAVEPASVPRLWRFVDRLPTGAMGKRDTPALLALFGHAS